MNAMTLHEAKQNLEHLINRVLADAEPTIVVSDSGQKVVVLGLDEYNSWQETLYLLSTPANRRICENLSLRYKEPINAETQRRRDRQDFFALSEPPNPSFPT